MQIHEVLRSAIAMGEGSEADEQQQMTAHITTIGRGLDAKTTTSDDQFHPVVVVVEGIGREGNHAFALYNIHVTRENAHGEQLASWSVMRRYSDFHTLHALIESRVRYSLPSVLVP